MSNKLFFLGVITVFAVLLPLTFESMYNYATYTASIGHVKILYESSHVDPVKPDDQQEGPIPLKKFEYVEKDNSVTIHFGGGSSKVEVYDDIPDFSYVKNFQVNQTFAFRCVAENDHTFLGFYKYIGTTTIFDEKYLLLWHFEGEAPKQIPCNYPEIIINSIDVVDVDVREDVVEKSLNNLKMRK